MAATLNVLVASDWAVRLVRRVISSALRVELANQEYLAHTSGADASLYKLRVFDEADRPFDEWLNPVDKFDADGNKLPVDRTPIVNVCVDSGSNLPGSSHVNDRYQAKFNLDVYAFALSQSANGGHVPADEGAADLALQRAGVVHNVLMAAPFSYLGESVRGLVGGRTLSEFETFSVVADQKTVMGLKGVRFAMTVKINDPLTQKTFDDYDSMLITVKNGQNHEVKMLKTFPLQSEQTS